MLNYNFYSVIQKFILTNNISREEMLLDILAEECMETAVRASKAIRFTLEEIQVDQPLTTAERIIYEFNDILAMMEILYDEKLIPQIYDFEAREKKKKKVIEYLKYSEKLGTLTHAPNK